MHYVFGAYQLDPQRYELHHAGVLAPLRPKVFQVPAYLVARHDRVVRKALGDRRPPHQYLRTVRGQGYRFVAPVEACDLARLPSTRPEESLAVLEGQPRTPPLPATAPIIGMEAALVGPPMPQGDGEYKPV